MIVRLWRAACHEPVLRFGIFMQFAWQRAADKALSKAEWWKEFVRRNIVDQDPNQ